jgi:zinc protease
MKRLPGSFVAAAALLAYAACGGPAAEKFSIKYAEKRAVLPNGLKLVVIPDKNTQMVQVDVRYEVGANEDPAGKAGLAHFAEHMMFQHRFGYDPEKNPGVPPTFDMLPQIATGYNAYTTWEKTHYFLVARKENLDTLLKLEAARLNAGCDTIEKAQFEREREVVRNEIRQRTGTPEGQVIQLLLDAAYPEGHAYNQTVGGNDAQLTNITFEDTCEFLEKYYVPSRATVIVAGNVDVDEVGNKVSQYFGGIPNREPAPRKEIAPVPDFKHEVLTHELATERSQVHVIWKMPPIDSPDSAATGALVSAMQGKLARFREDWNFAASISGGLLQGANGPAYAPIYVLSMELYDARDKDEALDYVWKATNGLHRGYEDGVFDGETKNLAKAGLIGSLEPLSRRADFVADRVQFNGKEVEFGGTQEYLLQAIGEIDELSGAKFREFLKGRLKKSNAKVVFIKSDKTGRRGDKRAGFTFDASNTRRAETTTSFIDPSEARRPLPAPESDSVLPRAERYTLGNGMKVVLLPLEGGMPIVTARLMFRVGSAHEPPDKAGLAELTAAFLRPPLDANFTRTGVSFRGFAANDTTSFVSRGMEIYLEVMIKGLERIIKAGHISQDGIESWQKRMKVSFQSERGRLQRAFAKEAAAAVYGDEHPYVTTGSATPASYSKMGLDLLTDFRRKHYSASNATLIVVGSFNPQLAKKFINDNFGEWGKGHTDQPVTAPAPARSGPEYVGVVGEPAPQLMLRVYYPGPSGIDGQYAARLVVSQMLSQRMSRVRAELGSTYGIGGGWSPSIGPSAYGLGGTIDAERAGETIKFIREQLDKLRGGEDFDIEFAKARRVVLKQLLAESGETGTLASRLANIEVFNLPPDYSDTLVRFVAAVPMAQVKALIASDLDPSREVVAAMADRPTLEKAFEQAGLDNVRFVEPK